MAMPAPATGDLGGYLPLRQDPVMAELTGRYPNSEDSSPQLHECNTPKHLKWLYFHLIQSAA
jgi:hypothetical protein